ncbi:hypothetical protein F4561_003668 [Lipingzhangella halophila]|uniref:FtsX-like permease family protein n=2 Tax=Lipingzhangella halophila TaxID=1783352 RepID=A0A7W7W3S9_9ACTN|nr:ABC transporter permease [Lipingzhangella halophila]MBB4932848.1 hypothetical protein [Lipingzhangella halophila]
MALAITLVMVVNSLSAGVENAQESTLEAVYGVGTDITVSQEASAPAEGGDGGGGGPGMFEFGSGEGTSEDGRTSLAESQLTTAPGTATFDAAELEKVLGVDGVERAAATLSLNNTTFQGEMPDMSQSQDQGQGGPPTGGGGEGGSSFDVGSFSVLGLDPGKSSVGPMSAVEVADGRSLTEDDAGKKKAVVDSDYATDSELVTGDTLEIGGEEFEIVGLVSSTSATGESTTDVYVPLGTAQQLADLDSEVSDIYVQAASSTAIDQVSAGIEEELPDTEVNTQQELASTVSGSLATASSLLSQLGTWLSVIVLAAAFLIAALLTGSGVARRTREFGTLKALGWSNGRVVRQVAGESVVQSLIGGVVGAAVGVAGVLAVNAAELTLTSDTSGGGAGQGPGGADSPDGAGSGTVLDPGGGRGAMPDQGGGQTSDIVLTAPISVQLIVVAIALAALGGLLAGAFGGWRASRLRPAEALRSLA